MSEGKRGWHAHYRITPTPIYFYVDGSVEACVLLKRVVNDDQTQLQNFTAWLNHIAPDGVIPPAPGGEGE